MVEFGGVPQGLVPCKRGCLNAVFVLETNVTSSRFFKSSEVMKLLGWTRSQLRWKQAHGEIQAVKRGIHWLYPASAVLLRQRETEARLSEDPGERDALAVEMFNEGASDAEIIRRLRLSLERVSALRRALTTAAPTPELVGNGSPAPPPARSIDLAEDREDERLRERYEARRELLAERRRALFTPEPPPKKKGS